MTPTTPERPDPRYVRGQCPVCGEEIVSRVLYTGSAGYRIIWECWAAQGEAPTCDWRRVL